MTDEKYLIEIDFNAIGNVQSSPALAQKVAQQANQRATVTGDMLSLFLMSKVMSRVPGGISSSIPSAGAGRAYHTGRIDQTGGATLQERTKKLSNSRKTQTFNERSVRESILGSYERSLIKSNEQLQQEFGNEQLKNEVLQNQLGVLEKQLGEIEKERIKRSLIHIPTDFNKNEGALEKVIGPKPLKGNKSATLKSSLTNEKEAGLSLKQINEDNNIFYSATDGLTDDVLRIPSAPINNIVKYTEKQSPPGN
jgi:hypothetical protein